MLVPSPTLRRQQVYSPVKQPGFTLIELLVVISIILILAGITFGISRGVQNAQARAKSKAELSVISQALDQFKSTYGDYPWVEDTTENADARDLLRALTGWAVLGNSELQAVSASDGPKKSFVDPTKLSLSEDFPTTGQPGNIYIQDPWGNNYVYAYKANANDSTWDNFGYLLFSEGTDSESATLPNDGVIDQAWRNEDENVDNIYAGE